MTLCNCVSQGVPNPVPRVKHPEWLHKKLAEMNDRCQQLKLDAMLPMLRAAGQAKPKREWCGLQAASALRGAVAQID